MLYYTLQCFFYYGYFDKKDVCSYKNARYDHECRMWNSLHPIRTFDVLSGNPFAEGCGGDAEKPFEAIGKVVAIAHVAGFRDTFQAHIRVQKQLFSLPEKKMFPVFSGGTSHLFPENLKKEGDTHATL